MVFVRITVVGLGRMGAALACALVDADIQVNGFDISPQARDKAERQGIRMLDDVAEVARNSDVVLTSLPTVSTARQVVFDLGARLRAGTLLIETSTCSPAFARDAAARLAERDVRFVDCPVSGKPPHTAMLVGGTEGVFGDATPLMERLAANISYLGTTGAGYGVKLLQQYVKYTRFLVAAEALCFAEHEGLDMAETVRALSSGTGALPGLASAEDYFLRDLDAIASHAPVATIAKDVELTRKMFLDAGFESPSFSALAEFFLTVDAGDHTGRPYPEAIDLLADFRFTTESPR